MKKKYLTSSKIELNLTEDEAAQYKKIDAGLRPVATNTVKADAEPTAPVIREVLPAEPEPKTKK